jgi:Ca-activated chloride channel family protein
MKTNPQARIALWVFFSLQAICSLAQPQNAARHQSGAASQEDRDRRRGVQQHRHGAPFHDKTDLVTLNVAVTNKNGVFTPGLKPQDFEVFEDGVRQEIAFFSEEDIPLDVGILLDTSGSLAKFQDPCLEAAREFIQASHQDDNFCFMTFSKRVIVQAELADGDTVINRLRLTKPAGTTAFYDAVYFGLEKIGQGKHLKRALLVISDGQDNVSRYGYEVMMKLLKETDAQVYCIGIGDTSSAGDPYYGKLLLKDLAEMTGGRAFFPKKPGEIEAAISRIAVLLRRQYSIGYYPSESGQSKRWRKLKVSIRGEDKPKKLIVSAREGYYPRP